MDVTSSDSLRATFVMKRGVRDLLRGVAARYGVSQSEIMNYAPFLFLVHAERSLRERQGNLGRIEFLASRSKALLDALPRHMAGPAGGASDTIKDLVNTEKQAVKQRLVHGPAALYNDEEFGRLSGYPATGDPLASEVAEALENVGAQQIAERFQIIMGAGGNSEDWGFFLDEEEEAALPEVEIDLGVESAVGTALPSQNGSGTHRNSPPDRAWHILVPTGALPPAKTNGEALAAFVRWVRENRPEVWDKLRDVRGRSRPLLAKSPEQLYPGRRDLTHYNLEAVPGWFVGTNYSDRDVQRLLQRATDAINLTWGIDVTLSLRTN